ncbi:MAG: LysR family transcriptional regulator, partial [Oscillospiraceae bacterium]|nr:LysR family transcriptional regulator [Oscillospiraceae bacterium]
MNIFQLTCFVTLTSASTFHEAAERLYISQSSFSNNIQAIERELQTSLVLRGAKSLSLTDAGREFLIYAEKIVSEYESMT